MSDANGRVLESAAEALLAFPQCVLRLTPQWPPVRRGNFGAARWSVCHPRNRVRHCRSCRGPWGWDWLSEGVAAITGALLLALAFGDVGPSSGCPRDLKKVRGEPNFWANSSAGKLRATYPT